MKRWNLFNEILNLQNNKKSILRSFSPLFNHLGRQRTLPAAAAALVMVFYYYCPASKHTHLRVMPRSATPRKMQSGGVLRSLLKCLQLHFFLCSLPLSLSVLYCFCFVLHRIIGLGGPVGDEIIKRNRLEWLHLPIFWYNLKIIIQKVLQVI